jgi:hypothetical protein
VVLDDLGDTDISKNAPKGLKADQPANLDDQELRVLEQCYRIHILKERIKVLEIQQASAEKKLQRTLYEGNSCYSSQ